MALTLLVAIPSDECEVVHVRELIRGARIGPAWCTKSMVLPTAHHPENITDAANFGSHVIYVGLPVGQLQCSPCVNPCSVVPIIGPQGGNII